MQVHINSFSFRNGYPPDSSGHGGGFVFDCRAIRNPGLIDELMDYNGKDKEIIDHIDQNPDAAVFFDNVCALIDPAIKRYLEKGFDSLTVSFGCTGGQHRSVYMAEKLADHIKSNFPEIGIKLHHREASGWPTKKDNSSSLK